MAVGSLLSYVAALSVATERVTELIKRIPGISKVLSTEKQGDDENLRVIGVYVLAIVVGTIICYYFPATIFQSGTDTGDPSFAQCLGYGLLASGGSSFWNSALDTFRNVKQQMQPKS